MGLNLPIVTETLAASENQSWLGSAHGTNECDPITLDGDTFLSAFPTGVVPSGVVLGKITATGLYAPYNAGAVAEIQTLTRTSTGGTITLTFDGETTGTIAASAAGFTAAAVLAALEALSNINPGDITVTGSAGGPLTVTFSGSKFLGVNVPALVVDNGSATGGTITQATTTQGAAGAATDGSEVARGHLFTTVDLGGTTAGTVDKVGAALFWHGEVIEANLPTGHGLDATAKATLKQIRYV